MLRANGPKAAIEYRNPRNVHLICVSAGERLERVIQRQWIESCRGALAHDKVAAEADASGIHPGGAKDACPFDCSQEPIALVGDLIRIGGIRRARGSQVTQKCD